METNKQKQLNDLVVTRLRAAFVAGVKLSIIISKTKISPWRIRSAACVGLDNPYRYSSESFTIDECNAILDAIEQIKNSL